MNLRALVASIVVMGALSGCRTQPTQPPPATPPSPHASSAAPESPAAVSAAPAMRQSDDSNAVAPAPAEPIEQMGILTPPPPPQPRINGAMVFGVRPGRALLYTIAATGQRPMTFEAIGLPTGASVDPQTGQLSGIVYTRGEYPITLVARNALGEARRPFKLVVGDTLALTPPMGWNSWNVWGAVVDEQKVRAAAEAMAEKGLVNHGWMYVVTDDGWQGPRGGVEFALQPNEKFPDIRGMVQYIHSLGLLAGIYSTPFKVSYQFRYGGSADTPDGKLLDGDPQIQLRQREAERRARREAATRPGFQATTNRIAQSRPTTRRGGARGSWRIGAYSFARQDARQWAAWGFDYLKYDWSPTDFAHAQEMSEALRDCGRDMVYSVSNTAVIDLGPKWHTVCNLWRITSDITDTWRSVARAFDQDKWAPFAAPGGWNDQDMLVLGHVGWGPRVHPTRLTPNEQYSHMSLWCLMSAPLMLGCDLTQLDDFTLNLITNDEVIAVNQDPLGSQGRLIRRDGRVEVWAKDMSDGSKAVGLFNRADDQPQQVSVNWQELGISGRQVVRDLWRQQDLGTFDNQFTARVLVHGVVLVRMSPAR